MSASLVGSEMCIRDSVHAGAGRRGRAESPHAAPSPPQRASPWAGRGGAAQAGDQGHPRPDR
eukprot:3233251-Alexandrium_andersonii.AAC.1